MQRAPKENFPPCVVWMRLMLSKFEVEYTARNVIQKRLTNLSALQGIINLQHKAT